MKRMLTIYLIAGLILIISLVFSLVQGDPVILSILNSLFITGMIYLIIGAFLYIFQKGFFNGIVYALKRFRKSTVQGKFLSQFDDIDSTQEAHKEFTVVRSYKITRSLLIIGSSLLVISLGLSYLLYT
ncbi:DUF3899 domain-containing protein [Bacillus sp. Marseille-Q1617]|uniref:DUF3899 domain-containing protein n=1 Tax=Bacillus sp. Marseille-Q1617 TaxID=2736887 RepID=UPI00158EFC20|nr:DUF3899 domain-containing protein [Bacillus sp. Marseille-Q1617]